MKFTNVAENAVTRIPASGENTRLEAFGREMDALRDRIRNQVGTTDEMYIRRVISWQKIMTWTARGLILGGAIFWQPLALVAGVLILSASQIIENMEIGHNVLHAQYDFMKDKNVNSRVYEWGPVVTSKHWKHLHNYVHHTYTNVMGRDHDIGYGFIRITGDQPWKPAHIWQFFNAAWLAFDFQHLTALHDARPMEYLWPKSWRPETVEPRPSWKVFFTKVFEYQRKAAGIMAREYLFFPLLAGPYFLTVLIANVVARTMTNVWEFAIIFCGHFTRNARFFTEEEYRNETRAGWYLRQILGSSNLEGSPLFCFMTGHLSHQVEHHLFPDIPAHRYPEMAEEVRRICGRYGIPYNTGKFSSQFATVLYRIIKFSFPWAKEKDHASVSFDLQSMLAPADAAADSVSGKWKTVTVDRVVRETDQAVSVFFRPGFRYEAGSFVSIRLTPEGRQAVRSYTLSSSAVGEEASVTVKKVAGGLVSNWLFENAKPGMTLEITEPAGEFTLDQSEKLLMISGGSGITPMMSMLRTLHDKDEKRDVIFLHAARNRGDVIFRDEILAKAAERREWDVKLILEEEAVDSAAEFSGRINHSVLETVSDLSERTVYLCGPAPMMAAVREILLSLGLPADQLKTEEFGSVKTLPAAGTSFSGPRMLELKQRGRVLQCSGEDTILEEVEKAGMEAEHGCRRGICHTCKVRKISGRVQNVVTGEISGDGEEDIRICVSQPTGDVKLVL